MITVMPELMMKTIQIFIPSRGVRWQKLRHAANITRGRSKQGRWIRERMRDVCIIDDLDDATYGSKCTTYVLFVAFRNYNVCCYGYCVSESSIEKIGSLVGKFSKPLAYFVASSPFGITYWHSWVPFSFNFGWDSQKNGNESKNVSETSWFNQLTQ